MNSKGWRLDNHRRICLLVLATVSIIILCGCGQRAQSNNGEEGKTPSEAELKGLIEAHFPVMDSVGPDAAKHYAESLARLRQYRGEVARFLISGYEKVPAHRYYLRWKIIFTLGELSDPVAIPLLVSIANQDLPTASSMPGMQPMSTTPLVPSENRIQNARKRTHINQTTAVLALAKVAAIGKSNSAVDALISLLDCRHQHVVETAAIELHRINRYPPSARAKFGVVTRVSPESLLGTKPRRLSSGRPGTTSQIKPWKNDPPPRVKNRSLP